MREHLLQRAKLYQFQLLFSGGKKNAFGFRHYVGFQHYVLLCQCGFWWTTILIIFGVDRLHHLWSLVISFSAVSFDCNNSNCVSFLNCYVVYRLSSFVNWRSPLPHPHPPRDPLLLVLFLCLRLRLFLHSVLLSYFLLYFYFYLSLSIENLFLFLFPFFFLFPSSYIDT